MTKGKEEPLFSREQIASIISAAHEVAALGTSPLVLLRRAAAAEKLVLAWATRTRTSPFTHFTELLRETLHVVNPLDDVFVFEAPSALEVLRMRIAAREGGAPDACDAIASVIAPRRRTHRGISSRDYDGRHEDEHLCMQYFVCRGSLKQYQKKVSAGLARESEVLTWLRANTAPSPPGSEPAKFVSRIGVAIARLRARRRSSLKAEVLRLWLAMRGDPEPTQDRIDRAAREIAALLAKRRRAKKSGALGR